MPASERSVFYLDDGNESISDVVWPRDTIMLCVFVWIYMWTQVEHSLIFPGVNQQTRARPSLRLYPLVWCRSDGHT
jgi:hypothetical protein